jgi:hypothetical protein
LWEHSLQGYRHNRRYDRHVLGYLRARFAHFEAHLSIFAPTETLPIEFSEPTKGAQEQFQDFDIGDVAYSLAVNNIDISAYDIEIHPGFDPASARSEKVRLVTGFKSRL